MDKRGDGVGMSKDKIDGVFPPKLKVLENGRGVG